MQNELDNTKFKGERVTSVKFSEFEKLLELRLWKMFDEDLSVFDELIREKARRITESLNSNKLKVKKIEIT